MQIFSLESFWFRHWYPCRHSLEFLQVRKHPADPLPSELAMHALPVGHALLSASVQGCVQ